MSIEESYNKWAAQYDTNTNATRDLEAEALISFLAPLDFKNCLEIGCGTGKNTRWLLDKATYITAIDFSAEMLAKAREKFKKERIEFIQADLTEDWTFVDKKYELVSFSLVLEHIKVLDPVFVKAAAVLKAGGYVYVGELHPFKQYSGSKARFESDGEEHFTECFTHHVSDFISAGKIAGLSLIGLNEYFDNGDRTGIPRILSLLFQKNTE